jgi:hypothetical protein
MDSQDSKDLRTQDAASNGRTRVAAVPEQRPLTRRGRKRVFHKIPPMPQPVAALWGAAGEEERQAAHRTCAALLETWLGKASRVEVASRLGVTPLRLWQLSQQATAGMLAGLLKQPRRRAMVRESLPPEEDPVKLRKRIVELEQDLGLAGDLIALLRELPGNRDRPPPKATRSSRPAKSARASKAPAGGKKSRPEVAGSGGSSAGDGALAD